jgi:hypothetical protein
MDITIQPTESDTHPGVWLAPCPMCPVTRMAFHHQEAAEALMEHLACIHEPEIAQIDRDAEEGGCDL